MRLTIEKWPDSWRYGKIEPRSEQIHQKIQTLKNEYDIRAARLSEVKKKQGRLDSVEMTVLQIEREKEALLAQSREVWRGNRGAMVAGDAEEVGRQNLQKLRRTIEETRDELQREKEELRTRLREIVDQQEELQKGMKR